MSKARQVEVDEVRVAREHRVGGEAVALESIVGKAVYEDVGGAKQLPQPLRAQRAIDTES